MPGRNPKGSEPEGKAWRKGHLVWAIPRVIPGKLQLQGPDLKLIKMINARAPFGLSGVAAEVYGTHDGDAAEEHLGIAQDLLWDV